MAPLVMFAIAFVYMPPPVRLFVADVNGSPVIGPIPPVAVLWLKLKLIVKYTTSSILVYRPNWVVKAMSPLLVV